MKKMMLMKRLGGLLLLLIGLAGCGSQPWQVSSVAGSTSGYTDGSAASAQFNTPMDVAVDEQGNLYVADMNNHCIRKITPNGVVSTLAGSSEVGHINASGGEARFSTPTGIALGPQGILFVADSVMMDPHPMHVRQVTLAGLVSTLAGGSEAGYKDGQGSEAFFRTPSNLAVDPQGNVIIADTTNHRIRKVTPEGLVSTLAGSPESGLKTGYQDGPPAEARFNGPRGVAVDAQGNVYVADTGNHVIRKISPEGVVSTLAGSGEAGFADGQGAAAQFSYPSDVAVDAQGNVYVADSSNHRIRKISPEGAVTTLAGSGKPGFQDGALLEAMFRSPEGITVDAQGVIYVADTGNHRIRRIGP